MFRFSKASWEKLKGVHEDLINVMEHAIQMSVVDFRITQGVRTRLEQQELYAQGRSKPGQIVTWTLKSRHIGGYAVDVVALVNGRISWDIGYYHQIAEAVKEAAAKLNVPVVWGGDWKRNKDYPHFELDAKIYKDGVTDVYQVASNDGCGCGGAVGSDGTDDLHPEHQEQPGHSLA